MRKVIAYFIKYPVAVNVIIMALVVLGVFGYSNLKSSFFPLTESNLINISVVYPGASPQEIEEGVVLLIENNLRGIVGVDRVTSTSSENSATITVETDRDYDINTILFDVKNAVDRIPNYPVGMEPPVVAKVEIKNEALTFVIKGKGVPLKTLKEEARAIESDLLNIKGITQVSLSGFPAEEIEIALKEEDIRAFNLTFKDVASAISKTNLVTTGGKVKTTNEEYLIRANNRNYYAEELENIVIKGTQDGSIIRLRDIATIRNQFSETPNLNYHNGDLSVKIKVRSTNSEDLIASADKTKAYIEKYNNTHNGIELSITQDRSISLKQRTTLLFENAMVGMLLVFIFLAFFLKPQLAFWVAMGLPVAFMGMFAFVGFFNVTINILSLFGMIIVIGILVDDGIVIAENIYHEHEKGKHPIRAAIDGTMQVLPSILSAILTTILAFSIFFFLDGDIGNFFGEVATIVALTLIISLVEALIILPAHIAHSKALKSHQKVYGFNIKAEQFMNFLRDKCYMPVLRFFMENVYTKLLGLLFPIVLLLLTIGGLMGGTVKSTFFPNMASDGIVIDLKMPEGTSLAVTDSILLMIEEKTKSVNAYFTNQQAGHKSVFKNTIRTLGPTTATGSLRINLLEGELRDFSADKITNAIQEAVGEVHGVEQLTFGSGTGFGGKAVSVSLLSNNIDELKLAKIYLKNALSKNASIKDITDTDPEGIKEIKITLKDHAYLLGFTLQDVINQVRYGFFGLEAQRFQRGKDEIKVWIRFDENSRNSIKNLDDMRLISPSGDRIAFKEIAEYVIERGEISINHLEGKREIRVEADMKNPKESASEAIAEVRNTIMPKIKAKYPSIEALYEGQNRQAELVINSAKTVVPIVLLLIYMVIVFTFRSYSQPLILLTMVPFSLIGVAWGHYIHGYAVNILSMLGVIALMGIVVNDGLVLISKLNQYLKEGLLFKDAIKEAGKSRFRAIFLTSLTTVAGLAPLIFETSRQARMLIPMAISITYGIIVATALTLITLPILLSFSNGTKVNIKWLWTGRKPSQESVERSVKELENEQEE